MLCLFGSGREVGGVLLMWCLLESCDHCKCALFKNGAVGGGGRIVEGGGVLQPADVINRMKKYWGKLRYLT